MYNLKRYVQQIEGFTAFAKKYFTYKNMPRMCYVTSICGIRSNYISLNVYKYENYDTMDTDIEPIEKRIISQSGDQVHINIKWHDIIMLNVIKPITYVEFVIEISSRYKNRASHTKHIVYYCIEYRKDDYHQLRVLNSSYNNDTTYV